MFSKRIAEAEVDAEVPLCVQWSCEKVATWVEHIGYPQYKECFTRNFINGRKLIIMEMSSLPKIGITDYKHMREISQSIRELLRQPAPDHWHTISMPEKDRMGMYLQAKIRTGKYPDGLTYSKFLKENQRQLDRLYWREEEQDSEF